MTARTIDRKALIDWFARELSAAQQERCKREDVTDTGELEWIVFERNKLMELINLRRARLNAPAVDMEAVERIENSAVGHVDYTSKLAIRAAELVLNEGGDTRRRRHAMMMTPEQRAELQAKAQPLMELLVEVLNELNDLGSQRAIANNNEILTAGGTVFLHSWTGKWQIGTRH